jgi:hypothetical protein
MNKQKHQEVLNLIHELSFKDAAKTVYSSLANNPSEKQIEVYQVINASKEAAVRMPNDPRRFMLSTLRDFDFSKSNLKALADTLKLEPKETHLEFLNSLKQMFNEKSTVYEYMSQLLN